MLSEEDDDAYSHSALWILWTTENDDIEAPPPRGNERDELRKIVRDVVMCAHKSYVYGTSDNAICAEEHVWYTFEYGFAYGEYHAAPLLAYVNRLLNRYGYELRILEWKDDSPRIGYVNFTFALRRFDDEEAGS